MKVIALLIVILPAMASAASYSTGDAPFELPNHGQPRTTYKDSNQLCRQSRVPYQKDAGDRYTADGDCVLVDHVWVGDDCVSTISNSTDDKEKCERITTEMKNDFYVHLVFAKVGPGGQFCMDHKGDLASPVFCPDKTTPHHQP